MGGRGNSGARNAGRSTETDYVAELLKSSDYVGQRNIEDQVNDQIRYHLPEGATWGGVDSVEVLSNPGGGRMGDVEVEYTLQFRIPVTETDADGYSSTSYEYEDETRREVFQVVLRKRG